MPRNSPPSVLMQRALSGGDDPELLEWIRRFFITLDRTSDPVSAVRSLALLWDKINRRMTCPITHSSESLSNSVERKLDAVRRYELAINVNVPDFSHDYLIGNV